MVIEEEWLKWWRGGTQTTNYTTILFIIWKSKLFKIISGFCFFFLQWPSLKGWQTSKQALISYSILARFHNIL